MAVTDIANSNLTFTGVPLGVQVTRVTDSSADWASVANNTYFYDKADKLIHFKNSGGTVLEIFSAGGLTYFTEAQNTTAPNATVPVDSLTAVASATDADFAVNPKGTGALLAQVPDNTATGGNKRGTYAVDWQRTRDNQGRVASGNYSTIVGGSHNTASGSYSIAGGYFSNASSGGGGFNIALGNQTTATGGGSTALGSNTVASGAGAVAIGSNNTQATGDYSVALGYGNFATQQGSFAFGIGSSATGFRSGAMGSDGRTFGIAARLVWSGQQQGTGGDTQKSTFLLQKRTTTNTATTLTADSGVAGSANQVILSNQSAYRFKGTIIGKQSGSTNACAWDIDGLIVRGATAGTTVLSVANVNLVSNSPAWGTPTLTADTTNGGLTVQVTGASATNIQWVANIETTEVIYA